MSDLTTLFLHQLADIYQAEKQLLKALPVTGEAAHSEELREAFETHVSETKAQIERLDRVFALFDKPAKGKKCKGIDGLIQEGEEIMSEMEDTDASDAGLICAAQKIEHYEIATYGCLVNWAELLGKTEAAEILEETLEEEKIMDEKLTEIADSVSHIDAEGEDDEEEEKD